MTDAPNPLRRWLPLIVIAAGAIVALVFLRGQLSFESLGANRATLLAWRDAHPVAMPALFVLAYTLVVAFSVPGAVWVTLTGGFLFRAVSRRALQCHRRHAGRGGDLSGGAQRAGRRAEGAH